SVRNKMNTRSSPQSGDGVGLPPFAPGLGLQANECPSRAWTINEIVAEQRRRSIAQNSPRARRRIRPKHLARGLGLIQLKHKPTDEQSVSPKYRHWDRRKTRTPAHTR